MSGYQQPQQPDPHHLLHHPSLQQDQQEQNNQLASNLLQQTQDQYDSSAEAVGSTEQSHHQQSQNVNQLLDHRSDQGQDSHTMADCLNGYPSSDSVAASYNSGAAVALYNSSLYAVNAKAAMLQHHSNYHHEQQQQQQQQSHLRMHLNETSLLDHQQLAENQHQNPDQVSEVAYMSAYQQQQQPAAHHLQQHLNHHHQQELGAHANLQQRNHDQYATSAGVPYHHNHDTSQTSGSNHSQLLHWSEHGHNRHTMAACLSGYQNSDSYGQGVAASLYSSSLYAANAKAAMMNQHQQSVSSYNQEQQQQQQQQQQQDSHEQMHNNNETSQLDHHHHQHSVTNHLHPSSTSQDAETRGQQINKQYSVLWNNHSSPLQTNPLLDSSLANRMATTVQNYHQLQQQQQQQQHLNQNSAEEARPSGSNCELTPSIKVERTSDTSISSDSQQLYMVSCSHGGSTSSTSPSSSVSSSHSFTSLARTEENPGNSTANLQVAKSNDPSEIKKPTAGAKRKQSQATANTPNATTKRVRWNGDQRVATAISWPSEDADQLNDIDESATYKDQDIEHTSTYIVVTNIKNGDRVKLSNEDLTCYSTRQLNKIVAAFPKETVTKLKQRRRTLKNRGYAQNCRHKRLDQKNKLEKENAELRRENLRQKHTIAELHQELHQYKQKLNQMSRLIIQNQHQQQQVVAVCGKPSLTSNGAN